jgi:hypothetical protein
VSGYFSGWNTGNMARDKAAVQNFLEGTTHEISVGAFKPSPKIWQQKIFRADNSHAKTLAILLAHNHPIDLLTGQRIDVTQALAWVNAKEYHHLFPRDYLKSRGISGVASNCLANIVMLTSVSNKQITNRPPSDYFRDVQKAAGSNLTSWLQSNLISDAALQAALMDDYTTFIEERSKTIDAHISAMTDW